MNETASQPAAVPPALLVTYFGNTVRSDWRAPPRDVALHLARENRFANALRGYWPVALHCLAVADILLLEGAGPLAQLLGLMHDAPEFCCRDVPTTIKKGCGEVPAESFARFEAEALEAMWRGWGLPPTFGPAPYGVRCDITDAWLDGGPERVEVNRVDRALLAAESSVFGAAQLTAAITAKYGPPDPSHLGVVRRIAAQHPTSAETWLAQRGWPDLAAAGALLPSAAAAWLRRYAELRARLGLPPHISNELGPAVMAAVELDAPPVAAGPHGAERVLEMTAEQARVPAATEVSS